jgi:WXXGXW repeat (2 copies)
MKIASRFWIASSFLILAVGIARVEAQTPAPSGGTESPPLDGPTLDLEPIPAGELRGTTSQPPAVPEDRTRARRIYAPKEPPAPIVERPVGARPGRSAQWVPGYWEWEPTESAYVWVGGSWQVPPVGSFWVDSKWLRDAGGWYRVPGFWSRRRDRGIVATEFATTTEPAWRTTGPPADHPDDTPGPAPGANYFFVPGHYEPNGDRLAWIPGFWARVQLGWDWVPARWVRRADGWQFREGSWALDPETRGTRISRRTTARPNGVPLPPAAIEPPAPGAGPDAATDRLPPVPRIVPDRDTIGDLDELDPDDGPTVITRRPLGMPFYVIRPPGAYPYGPGGVVVPGAVPPFVRRLLDRVLP